MMAEECTHDCSSCGSACASRQKPQSLLAPANAGSRVKKVIGVVSGKGGVGKSLVTGLLACEGSRKRREGYVHQPAAGARHRPRYLARQPDCGHGEAVLDGCVLGGCGLPVCGYAAGNGRRAADGVPVAAGGWHRDCLKPAGAGRHDCGESRQNGADDEPARTAASACIPSAKDARRMSQSSMDCRCWRNCRFSPKSRRSATKAA